MTPESKERILYLLRGVEELTVPAGVAWSRINAIHADEHDAAELAEEIEVYEMGLSESMDE